MSSFDNTNNFLLSFMHGIHFSPILQFFTAEDAVKLRLVCRDFHNFTKQYDWSFWDIHTCGYIRPRYGFVKNCCSNGVQLWRACFPKVSVCRVPKDIRDLDLQHLSGIRTLAMNDCRFITDAGLVHLAGIHTLYMDGCDVTDTGLVHLAGIHTLYINCCDSITDVGIAHLVGINTLSIVDCVNVTPEQCVKHHSLEYLITT